MIPLRFRRPFLIAAAAMAVLSLVAVGVVMTMAFSGLTAPVWVTSAALYGLPVAFLMMLAVVADGIARRRAGKSAGR
jgi:hypothetical protein